MKHWFKDQQLRSLLRNTSYLGMSRAVAAVCGIATIALAGRALGLLLLGTLILITSYTKAVSGLAKFQSWQVIVRYGGYGIAHGDPEHFKIATGFAFSLDLVSGIAGMLVAVALLPFISQWVGIQPQYLWLAMFYCTLLPTTGAATPSGVLRVLDRFDLIGWSDTLTPISRAILAALAYLIDAPFAVYVAIWMTGRAVGIELSPRPYYVMGPLLFLVILIPFTINGLAVREAFFVSFLTQLGVDKESALACGFLFFVVTIALALPGAVILAVENLRGVTRPRAPELR